MKKLLFTILALFMILDNQAQENSKKISVGIHLNKQQNNFGYGLNIGSGNILNQPIHFKIKANMSFIENINDPNKTTWNSFYNFNAGFSYAPRIEQSLVQPYIEIGGAAILTCFKFTEEKIHFAPYALAGMELNMNTKSSIFFEMGGIYSAAVAERLVNRPTYISGFTTAVGWRFHWK